MEEGKNTACCFIMHKHDWTSLKALAQIKLPIKLPWVGGPLPYSELHNRPNI
jgi:hypothetical protein